jgi:hypothetical protein
MKAPDTIHIAMQSAKLARAQLRARINIEYPEQTVSDKWNYRGAFCICLMPPVSIMLHQMHFYGR